MNISAWLGICSENVLQLDQWSRFRFLPFLSTCSLSLYAIATKSKFLRKLSTSGHSE